VIQDCHLDPKVLEVPDLLVDLEPHSLPEVPRGLGHQQGQESLTIQQVLVDQALLLAQDHQTLH